MAFRRPIKSKLKVQRFCGGKFRQRYDDLEARRVRLLDRLSRLGENGQRHPGYARVLTLLNPMFRKSRLEQRVAVLKAAAWLIDVLEQVIVVL